MYPVFTLPLAVNLQRFLTQLFDFNFGIFLSFSICYTQPEGSQIYQPFQQTPCIISLCPANVKQKIPAITGGDNLSNLIILDHTRHRPRWKDPTGNKTYQSHLPLCKSLHHCSKIHLEHPLTLASVKKKYKDLAKKYHPDVSKKDATLFQKLSEAYSNLIAFLENKG